MLISLEILSKSTGVSAFIEHVNTLSAGFPIHMESSCISMWPPRCSHLLSCCVKLFKVFVYSGIQHLQVCEVRPEKYLVIFLLNFFISFIFLVSSVNICKNKSCFDWDHLWMMSSISFCTCYISGWDVSPPPPPPPIHVARSLTHGIVILFLKGHNT